MEQYLFAPLKPLPMSFIKNLLTFTLMALLLASFSDCNHSNNAQNNGSNADSMANAQNEIKEHNNENESHTVAPRDTSRQDISVQDTIQQEPKKGPLPRPLEPSWTGGNYEAIQDFLKKHVKYPEEAKRNNITGIVYVMFTVKTNGETDNFQVRKGLGYGCDEEAIRVIKKMGKWNPGKIGGKAVDMEYSLGVPFGE